MKKQSLFRKTIFFIFIVLPLVSSIAVVTYSYFKLKDRTYSEVVNLPEKNWIARGLYDKREDQNTIGSFERSFKAGAMGVEMDLHYDAEMQKFIISHDHPVKDEHGKLIYILKDGKQLTLEEVFREFNEKYYFWLDYKKMGDQSYKDTMNAIKRLSEITGENDLKQRIYIESTHPYALSLFSKAGFKTIFDIGSLPERYHFSTIVMNAYKCVFAWGNFSVMAMHAGTPDDIRYGPVTRAVLGDIPVFLYHVEDNREFLQELANIPQVRVILAGAGISINRSDIKGVTAPAKGITAPAKGVTAPVGK
jgi:hypothetical protein